MDKLQMAHDYLLKIMKDTAFVDERDIYFFVDTAWQYADAMQAEADKREDKTRPEVLDEEWRVQAKNDAAIYGTGFVRVSNNNGNIKFERLDPKLIILHYYNVEEWQPDWSQAPKGVEGWKANPEGTYSWTSRNGGHVDSAPSFNYQGNWQDSLRKRPQGK